ELASLSASCLATHRNENFHEADLDLTIAGLLLDSKVKGTDSDRAGLVMRAATGLCEFHRFRPVSGAFTNGADQFGLGSRRKLALVHLAARKCSKPPSVKLVQRYPVGIEMTPVDEVEMWSLTHDRHGGPITLKDSKLSRIVTTNDRDLLAVDIFRNIKVFHCDRISREPYRVRP